MTSWNVSDASRPQITKSKAKSKKMEVPAGMTSWNVRPPDSFPPDCRLITDYCPLTTVLWPRRESSRARPRPSLAFRRGARLLPSGWPRRESNPDLAFRKRLFYPLNYSANISTLYSLLSTLPLAYTHHYAPSSGFPPASSGKSAYVYLLTCPWSFREVQLNYCVALRKWKPF